MSAPGGAAAPLRIGIVAGEASGDQLGAALIEALRARVPQLRVLRRRRPEDDRGRVRGLGARRGARGHGAGRGAAASAAPAGAAPPAHRALRAARPDVFVGIDAPEFNSASRQRLKAQGLRTVQYVSPQVWAWRQGRVRTIGQACDLVLCLLPFETAFLRAARRARGVRRPSAGGSDSARGRPRGARAALGSCREAHRDRAAARQPPGARSRGWARTFAGAAAWLAAAAPRRAVHRAHGIGAVRAAVRALSGRRERGSGHPPHRRPGAAQRSRPATLLVASGTATLETLLSRRPMVVAYRFSAVTAFLLRDSGAGQGALLLATEPARRPRAGAEFLQEQVDGAKLGAALLARAGAIARARERARGRISSVMHRRAARRRLPARAADAILALLRGSADRGTARVIAGVDEAGAGRWQVRSSPPP